MRKPFYLEHDLARCRVEDRRRSAEQARSATAARDHRAPLRDFADDAPRGAGLWRRLALAFRPAQARD